MEYLCRNVSLGRLVVIISLHNQIRGLKYDALPLFSERSIYLGATLEMSPAARVHRTTANSSPLTRHKDRTDLEDVTALDKLGRGHAVLAISRCGAVTHCRQKH